MDINYYSALNINEKLMTKLDYNYMFTLSYHCLTCILNVPQKLQKMQKVLFSDDSRYHDCFVASNKK